MAIHGAHGAAASAQARALAAGAAACGCLPQAPTASAQPGPVIETRGRRAPRGQMLPGPLPCVPLHHRPAVTGGGPAAPAAGADPAVAVLATLLGDASPATSSAASPARELAAQVAALFSRLVTLVARPDAAPPAGIAGAASAQHDGAAAAPLQPAAPAPFPAPFGAQHDPATHAAAPGADAAAGDAAAADAGDDAARGPDTARAPSSWVAVPGMFRRDSLQRHGNHLVARMDALREALGVTRLQLALLSVVAPFATAFLIQVVVSMLAER